MGALKILPGNIANMIAAGEVVQRPASVVKELVENSMDAGATSVEVVVTDAGRTLIQVIDDGCGMSPSDAVLCFERHATSKIASESDLGAILTYGFRGEALPSIASVSDVTLRTRREGDEVATQVKIGSYNHVETSSVSGPVGTSISVRNLFYNTPARRKFLKSDNVELRHIVEEFSRIVLTRPDVAFTLRSNGKDLYILKKAKSLKFRAQDLLGPGVVSELVDIESQTSMLRLSGFLGRPDAARKSQTNQYFFVNGRYFRSSYLHKAVLKAYEDFVPDGSAPAYFLYIDIDPSSVDVNVHPAKTEIKFEDEPMVFQIIYAAVKETLGRNSFGSGIDFDAEGAVDLPVFGRNFDQYHPVGSPEINFDPSYNPFEQSGPAPEIPKFPKIADADYGSYKPATEKKQDYSVLFDGGALATRVLSIHGKYILTPVKSGVMAVNVRRAWERVLYDRFLAIFAQGGRAMQSTVFPEHVEVGAEARMLLEENDGLLRSLGFEITPFGRDTVQVSGVPEGFSVEGGKVESMVYDLLLVLREETGGVKEVLDSALAEKFARLGAASAKVITTDSEAQALVDSLLGCENAEYTASGRKIISIISSDELEKRF